MERMFMRGETVKTTRSPKYGDGDIHGVVEDFHDWWIMVRMDESGILYPFMESELEHDKEDNNLL